MLIEIKMLEKVHPKARGSRRQVCVLKCDECTSIFEGKFDQSRHQKHFCSQICGSRASSRLRQNRVTKPCADCGNDVTKSICWLKQANWFCNQKCYGSWRSKQDFVRDSAKNMSTPEAAAKATATRKEKWTSGELVHSWTGRQHTQATKDRISEHHISTGCLKGEKNGMWGRNHTEEAKASMSEKHAQLIVDGKVKPYGSNARRGVYESTKTHKHAHYRSAWELEYMKWLDQNDNVETWVSEPLRISYYYNDNKRWYVPDFLVTYSDGSKQLIEIKPKEFVESEKVKLKSQAANQHCEAHGLNYKLLTGDDLQRLDII